MRTQKQRCAFRFGTEQCVRAEHDSAAPSMYGHHNSRRADRAPLGLHWLLCILSYTWLLQTWGACLLVPVLYGFTPRSKVTRV